MAILRFAFVLTAPKEGNNDLRGSQVTGLGWDHRGGVQCLRHLGREESTILNFHGRPREITLLRWTLLCPIPRGRWWLRLWGGEAFGLQRCGCQGCTKGRVNPSGWVQVQRWVADIDSAAELFFPTPPLENKQKMMWVEGSPDEFTGTVNI